MQEWKFFQRYFLESRENLLTFKYWYLSFGNGAISFQSVKNWKEVLGTGGKGGSIWLFFNFSSSWLILFNSCTFRSFTLFFTLSTKLFSSISVMLTLAFGLYNKKSKYSKEAITIMEDWFKGDEKIKMFYINFIIATWGTRSSAHSTVLLPRNWDHISCVLTTSVSEISLAISAEEAWIRWET